MKEFLKKHWTNILSWIIGLVIGVLLNIPTCKKIEPEVIKVLVHDTITIDSIQIKWKEKPVEVLRIDTFYTTKEGDTIKTPEIPIIKKVYEDTISTDSTSTEIKIQYSGFKASIDEIQLRHNYYNTKEIIVKEPKRVGLVWAIGPSLGYSVTVNPMNGQMNHGFNAGVTLTLGIGGIIK